MYYGGTATQWANISFGNIYSNPLYQAGNLYLNKMLAKDIKLEGTTIIGDYAFYGCSSLENVTIGDGVTTVSGYAFYKCTSLENVTIGDSVTSIGSSAFGCCSSLVSITLPFIGGNANATEASKSTLFGYIFGTTTYNGGTASPQYYASGSYETYYIPTTLTTVTISGGDILYGAFNNCISLTCITISNGATSIGDHAFYGCNSLTSITIPDSVKSIGDYAFYGCNSLTSVTIGNSVTSIGSYAFEYCYKLIEVYNLSSLTITAGSTDNGYVGYYAKNVYTSESGSSDIITQDGYLFYDDNGTYYLVRYKGSTTELTLPTLTVNGETKSYAIYEYAFYNDTKIISITIPDGVTSIGTYAFYYCTALTSVTIGESVASIGTYAFYNCTALTEINFNATVMEDLSSRNYVFYNAGQSGDGITVTIGANVTKIPAYLFYPNIYYNGIVNAPKITSVVFKDGSVCKSIGDYAFPGCTSLTSITIPDNVISIGNNAFNGCVSLTSITIPNSVTSIGYRAFYNCNSLTNVTFEDSSGWYVTTTSGATSGTTISSSDLTNTSTAATYLKSDTYYSEYYWYKSES